MISYVIEAAKCVTGVIRVLSDDTDVFVFLIYWVYREEMTSKGKMGWHIARLDNNATCADLDHDACNCLACRPSADVRRHRTLTPKENSAR